MALKPSSLLSVAWCAVAVVMVGTFGVAAQDFDASKAAHMAYDALAKCRIPDDLDDPNGDPSACQRRDILWLIMQVHGYCWDRSEYVFVLCSDPDPERPENKAVYR